MTDYTRYSQLRIPTSDEEYANGALAMEQLAEDTDTALTGVQTAWGTASTKPAFVLTESSTTSYPAGFDTPMALNYVSPAVKVSITSPYAFGGGVWVLEQNMVGWWNLYATITTTPSGTVTSNSFRRLGIYVFDDTDSTFPLWNFLDEEAEPNQSSSTSNEVGAFVYLGMGYHVYPIFNHSNASSVNSTATLSRFIGEFVGTAS